MTENAWRNRIVCDPELHHGEPCVRGTRIPVAILVASLTDLNFDDLLHEYQQVSSEDVQASLYYAAEAAQSTMVV